MNPTDQPTDTAPRPPGEHGPGRFDDADRPETAERDEHTPEGPDERLPGWPELIAVSLARGLLAALLSLAAWAAVPALIGWHPTTVMTGSMMPRLHVGDVAVSRPLDGRAPTLGTVLLFEDPDHPGRLRLHRFVAVDPQGRIVTRGDANPDSDSSPIVPSAIVGVGTLRIPFVGLPVLWLRTGGWLPLGVTVAGLVGLIALAGRAVVRHDEREPAPEPEETSRSARPARGRTSVVRAVMAVPTLSVTVAVLLAVGVPARAAFSDTTTAATSMAAAPYFSCANAVAAASPWLYYRMDESSAGTLTAVDSSGNGRTGTYSQLGRTTEAARACTRDTGYGMTFNGSTGSLSSPQFTATPPNTFTVAIWFKTTTTKGGKLIGWGNSQTGLSGSYDRHLYMTNAGAVVFGVYPGAVKTVTSVGGLNDGRWHQVVGTLSTAGMVLYLDGVQVATDPTTTAAEQNGSGYWRIGYDNTANWVNSPTSNYFAGTLDDAAVYLTALSATAVRNQYLAGT